MDIDSFKGELYASLTAHCFYFSLSFHRNKYNTKRHTVPFNIYKNINVLCATICADIYVHIGLGPPPWVLKHYYTMLKYP